MISYILGMFCGLMVCCLFAIMGYGVYTTVRDIYKHFAGK